MKTAGAFLLVVALALLAAWIIVGYANMPVVEKQVGTEKCLRVATPPNTRPMSCREALKGRYETVWVAK